MLIKESLLIARDNPILNERIKLFPFDYLNLNYLSKKLFIFIIRCLIVPLIKKIQYSILKYQLQLCLGKDGENSTKMKNEFVEYIYCRFFTDYISPEATR